METSAGRKDWPLRLCKHSRPRWDQSKGWASCFSPIQEDLVPALCSSLDLEGVIFKILTFLPYYKIYQLRTVCKAWNTLLRSPAFLHAWSAAPHEEWVVMARKLPGPCLLSRELVAYDPAADRWMSLQHLLDSCPPTALCTLGGPSLGCVANPSLAGNVLFCLSPLAGSSGAPGLICFLNCHFTPSTCPSEFVSVSHMTQHPRVYSLLVLNLFTGSHRVLPPPLEQFNRFTFCEVEGSDQLVSMQLLPGNNYRVFVQNRHFNIPGPIEIYDSCRGSWKVGRSCDRPGDAKIASAADLSNADLVQFLTGTQIVYAYNVKLDEWSQVFGEFPVSRFRFPKLVRHRGRVFLAAVPHVESFFRGFIVWELRLHHSSPHSAAAPGTPIADWVEVARTPERYWRGFYSADAHSADKGVRIIFSGGLICMTPVHDTHEGACNPPLVYDLVRNSWFHLQYYKGGGVLFKVYVIGHIVKVVGRFSLPGVCENEKSRSGVIPFPRVSCAAASADGADLGPNVKELPPKEMLESLSRELRCRLGLSLFNLDMIREGGKGSHFYVIDINYFPGYGKMPDYENVFTEFLSSLADKKRK